LVIRRGETTKTIAQPPRASTNERCADIAGPNPEGRFSIANEIDMIQVRRTAEHDSFEVVVREGKAR